LLSNHSCFANQLSFHFSQKNHNIFVSFCRQPTIVSEYHIHILLLHKLYRYTVIVNTTYTFSITMPSR
jgi:hypothetical protein